MPALDPACHVGFIVTIPVLMNISFAALAIAAVVVIVLLVVLAASMKKSGGGKSKKREMDDS